MQRKKVSTGTNNAAAVLELDDDEQLIETVTTTKAIGRQRRPKLPDPEPDAITIEPEPDDEDETDDQERPAFSDTSLAALLYGDGDEPLESQYCTVMIRRNPDSMNDRFLTPCGSLLNLAPMRNVELTAERIDIEERVRSEYGGGHYFFQLQFDSRLRSSWKATLADDPAAVAKAKADAAPHPITPTAPAPVAAADPFDSFLDNLEKQKRMRDLLFGPEAERMQAEIDRLRIEATKTPPTTTEPKSEKLSMLELALATTRPEVTERVLNSVFPSEEEGSRHWIADVIQVGIENKDTIIGLIGSLFGGAAPANAPQPNMLDMLKQPAPAALPQHRSAFARTKPPADPSPAGLPSTARESAELPPPAESEFIGSLPRSEFVATDPLIAADDLSKGDETAIDAEITNEVKDAKPKRKRDAAA